MRSHLELESNTFRENTGKSISSKTASIIDSHSKYEQNWGDSGSCITIMIESTYKGTDITFDYNEAVYNGGAVHVTSESVFTCDSCIFTNNKANSGGAIYAESDGQATITASTFYGNIASGNGSALFFTSSIKSTVSSVSSSTF